MEGLKRVIIGGHKGNRDVRARILRALLSAGIPRERIAPSLGWTKQWGEEPGFTVYPISNDEYMATLLAAFDVGKQDAVVVEENGTGYLLWKSGKREVLGRRKTGKGPEGWTYTPHAGYWTYV